MGILNSVKLRCKPQGSYLSSAGPNCTYHFKVLCGGYIISPKESNGVKIRSWPAIKLLFTVVTLHGQTDVRC